MQIGNIDNIMKVIEYKGYIIETLDGYNFAEIYKNKKIINVCYNLDIAKNEINKMLQARVNAE